MKDGWGYYHSAQTLSANANSSSHTDAAPEETGIHPAVVSMVETGHLEF